MIASDSISPKRIISLIKDLERDFGSIKNDRALGSASEWGGQNGAVVITTAAPNLLASYADVDDPRLPRSSRASATPAKKPPTWAM